jgi:hypothetical protein
MLSGCAAPDRVAIETPPGTASESSFVLSDARPEDSKQRSTNQAATIYWFGDDQLDPPPPILIERALRRADNSLRGTKVVLKRFSLSFQRTSVQQSPMASYNGFTYGGLGTALTAMLDTGRSPDFCSASVEIEIDGALVRAGAAGDVSKYAGESGVQGILEQLLDRLVDAVNTHAATIAVEGQSTHSPAAQGAPTSERP